MTERAGAAVRNVVVEIDIEAPAAEVFEALVDPDAVVQWWADDGNGYRCTRFRSERRAGGSWWSEHRGAGDAPVCILAGEYMAYEPPSRLAFTWRFERYTAAFEALPESTVTILLQARGDATHVQLTHAGLTDAKQAADHEAGWHAALRGLERHVMHARPV